MIVPSNSLLLWVALIVVPFAILGTVDPSLASVSLAVVSVLGLVAGVDALAAMRNTRGVSIELGPLVRTSQDRPTQVEVKVRNQRRQTRSLRLALAFPREIEISQEDMQVRVPSDSEWSRVFWPCIPRRRGAYQITTACMEASSPLNLWVVRATRKVAGEVRVYPNLSEDRKQLSALFLNRGAFGLHAQRQIGKGREFEKLREYVPGDGFDEIHWKATARRGRPITKVFQIERTQEVYVIMDASRLSARNVNLRPAAATRSTGSPENPEKPKETSTLERYITAALVLGLAAEQQGDLFGLLTFSNRVDGFLRASNGKGHYNSCRDALYTLQPKIVSPDFDELSTFIRLRIRRRALLLFLTALDDPAIAQSFVRNIDLVCHQHLVLVNMIQPSGVAQVFSNGNLHALDDLYGRLAGHLQWQKLRSLGKVLQRRGVQFSLMENERLSADLVSQYLRVKRRQLL